MKLINLSKLFFLNRFNHRSKQWRNINETFFNFYHFSQSSTSPEFDGQSHPLSRGTLMDLFIRQQMMDRGIITFTRPRSRFRLVEPISLTDEFESWTFDHFRNLLDFWLTVDLTNKNKFPNQWKLNSQAKINYAIVERLANADDDQTSKHLERPSTKSLQNFIRDICQIEDNGMFKSWFEGLSEKENVSTYAHLTNLNQKEWDRIKSLPMNALKTIKFYVDREKQMVEERKTKKIEDPNQSMNKLNFFRLSNTGLFFRTRNIIFNSRIAC